jgi:chitinase
MAIGLESQTLELDVDRLSGGSQSFLRVVASDGFLSGEDVIGPFSVPTHAPDVEIVSPEADTIFWPVQLVVFQGRAYDLEDGQLTGTSLEWSSSLDGSLGTGEVFSTVDLSTGEHIITLQATDSDSMVTQVQQTITVQTGSRDSHGIFLPVIIRGTP